MAPSECASAVSGLGTKLHPTADLARKVWAPHVRWAKLLSSTALKDAASRNELARVEQCSGVVSINTQGSFKISCPSNFRWYPFDTQVRILY